MRKPAQRGCVRTLNPGARSVFKLEELDRAHHLFGRGDRVLDLGCAPGSWLQYAGGLVGPTGALVGIDRTAITGVANARLLVGDVFEVTPEALRGACTACVIDVAPRRNDRPSDHAPVVAELAL